MAHPEGLLCKHFGQLSPVPIAGCPNRVLDFAAPEEMGRRYGACRGFEDMPLPDVANLSIVRNERSTKQKHVVYDERVLKGILFGRITHAPKRSKTRKAKRRSARSLTAAFQLASKSPDMPAAYQGYITCSQLLAAPLNDLAIIEDGLHCACLEKGCLVRYTRYSS